MSARILMILTSHQKLGESGKATGLWAEELATPYYALRDAGAELLLASPRGGQAPIDPASIKARGENGAVIERMLADQDLQTALANTNHLQDLRMADFDAVFFPGGHGTMWDLPQDAQVRRIVEEAHAARKYIVTVCHGAAALVSAQRADGQPLVAGLRVNAFTDAEEIAVGLQEVVPFMLEARLRALGGIFEHGPQWQPFAVRDDILISGQNPQSSHLVAQELLGALQLAA